MAMMQQPQMVPPGLQAMKPVTPMATPDGYGAMVRAVAQANDLNELARLAKMPYGFLAAGKINELNRVAQSAQAAEQPTQDLNQQNLQQLAQQQQQQQMQQQQMQMQMAQNMAANESMGVPNIVNQMEQNPTMMAASGGMVEGYNKGETVEEKRLREFKENLGVGEPRSRVSRGLTAAGQDLLSIDDAFKMLPDFGISEYLFDKTLSDAEKNKLIEKGIDPDKYIENPEAAIKAAVPPAPGTASPTDTKESPYSLTSDATIGDDSGIRVIDTTDRSLSDAKDRAFAGLDAITKNLPGSASKLDRLKEINKSDILGDAKTFEDALRQRRQAAGLGELGAGQLTRAEEAAEKDKALARQQANLKLVEAGKAIQQGQKGGIGVIGDVLGSLAERKVAADAGERTAERLLTAKRDAVELKREAEARGDVQAGLKFDMDIADANLKIRQKNVQISNEQFKMNKNAETQQQKILADIGLKKSQLELDFLKLDQMGKYRDSIADAQLMIAQAKSGGATQKDLITLTNNLTKNIIKFAEVEGDYGDPAKAKEFRSKVANLLNLEVAAFLGLNPKIETIADDN